MSSSSPNLSDYESANSELEVGPSVVAPLFLEQLSDERQPAALKDRTREMRSHTNVYVAAKDAPSSSPDPPPSVDMQISIFSPRPPPLPQLDNSAEGEASDDSNHGATRSRNVKTDEHPVKVVPVGKKRKNFAGLKRVQSFITHPNGVHLLRFNIQCNQLAVALQIYDILLYRVRSREDVEKQTHQVTLWHHLPRQRDAHEGARHLHELEVIEETPFACLRGHEADVKDMAWSQLDCLLSASNDRTVRLWYPQRSSSALKTFVHPAFVTCIAFNRADENVFISGCSDCRVRMFSVENDLNPLQEERMFQIPTALGIKPSGDVFIVGTARGRLRCYELKVDPVSGWRMVLRTVREVSVSRRFRGRSAKVNNIDVADDKVPFIPSWGKTTNLLEECYTFVVSCNDSTLRIYRFEDYALIGEMRGHKNPIHLAASSSRDGHYVLVGSEPSSVMIYDSAKLYAADPRSRRRGRVHTTPEHFRAHVSRLTCAQFVPLTVQPLERRHIAQRGENGWGAATPLPHASEARPNFLSESGTAHASSARANAPPLSSSRLRSSASPLSSSTPPLSAVRSATTPPKLRPPGIPHPMWNAQSATGRFIVTAASDGELSVFYSAGFEEQPQDAAASAEKGSKRSA